MGTRTVYRRTACFFFSTLSSPWDAHSFLLQTYSVASSSYKLVMLRRESLSPHCFPHTRSDRYGILAYPTRSETMAASTMPLSKDPVRELCLGIDPHIRAAADQSLRSSGCIVWNIEMFGGHILQSVSVDTMLLESEARASKAIKGLITIVLHVGSYVTSGVARTVLHS